MYQNIKNDKYIILCFNIVNILTNCLIRGWYMNSQLWFIWEGETDIPKEASLLDHWRKGK